MCLDEHMANVHKQAAKEEETRRSFRSLPHLQPVRGDPEVKNHLNTYSDGLLRANQIGIIYSFNHKKNCPTYCDLSTKTNYAIITEF